MIYNLNILGITGPEAMLTLAALVLWCTFWKGLALWHSARRGQNRWFVAILLVNLFGLLEIFYLFFVAKVKPEDLFSGKK